MSARPDPHPTETRLGHRSQAARIVPDALGRVRADIARRRSPRRGDGRVGNADFVQAAAVHGGARPREQRVPLPRKEPRRGTPRRRAPAARAGAAIRVPDRVRRRQDQRRAFRRRGDIRAVADDVSGALRVPGRRNTRNERGPRTRDIAGRRRAVSRAVPADDARGTPQVPRNRAVAGAARCCTRTRAGTCADDVDRSRPAVRDRLKSRRRTPAGIGARLRVRRLAARTPDDRVAAGAASR